MRKTCTGFFLLLTFVPFAAQAQHTITTVAGGGPNNVPALSAAIVIPSAIARDSLGNLYICSNGYSQIYRVDSSGQLTVVAGNGGLGYSGDGGPATSAELTDPSSVFVDGSGNIFIADDSRIREVVAATGRIQTVAGNGGFGYAGDGGPATRAQLAGPSGSFVDGSSNIFIADSQNNRVREVVAATGQDPDCRRKRCFEFRRRRRTCHQRAVGDSPGNICRRFWEHIYRGVQRLPHP